MTTYSYTRSSQIEVSENNSDLATALEQEDLQVQTYALKHNLQVHSGIIDNGINWSTDFIEREHADSLVNQLETGDIVLTYSIERMFSSCEDLYHTLNLFAHKGIHLIVTSMSADISDPKFCPPFQELLSIFHSLEKRRSTERIKMVKRNQRDKGRFLGGSRPFGYMIHANGRLIENATEQKVLKRILEMKRQGKSLRAISSEVSTPLVPVSFKTVQRLIKRHEAQPAVSVVS